jgi:hypothetical protein
VGTGRTLFFFDPVFRDPEPLGRQIDHLASLGHFCGLGTQILLTAFTGEDRMKEDLIGRLDLVQVMAWMTWLSPGLLATLFPQALGSTLYILGERIRHENLLR